MKISEDTKEHIRKWIFFACGLWGAIAGMYITSLEFAGSAIIGLIFALFGVYYVVRALYESS